MWADTTQICKHIYNVKDYQQLQESFPLDEFLIYVMFIIS